VAYPIFEIPRKDLHRLVWQLEESVIRTLGPYDLAAERLEGYPGVWLAGKKIAAVGLAVRNGITRHGLALNVAPELAHFGLFVPCGIAGCETTSIKQALGRELVMAEVTERFVQAFAEALGREVVWREPESLGSFLPTPIEAGMGPGAEQPAWLWQRLTPESEAVVGHMERLLAGWRLHTVCQEARCPNIVECFGRGTATFLILGDTCTRGCRFCAVKHGRPLPLDADEPQRVATAAARLGLQHIVITSVTRDDLTDGGASQFAATIDAVRRRLPAATIEVLIPDLGGAEAALRTILDARPHVLNHNLETVPRLYEQVRSRASYQRSLALLARAKAHAPQMATKSGLMLGLGEHTAEVLAVMRDLRRAGCNLLTLGQYLQPTSGQIPVQRYVPPQEFESYRDKAERMGFKGVAAGPLTRSSHRAEALWAAASHR
jgi:lipoic acid synthetase